MISRHLPSSIILLHITLLLACLYNQITRLHVLFVWDVQTQVTSLLSYCTLLLNSFVQSAACLSFRSPLCGCFSDKRRTPADLSHFRTMLQFCHINCMIRRESGKSNDIYHGFLLFKPHHQSSPCPSLLALSLSFFANVD